ncbi:hypothetical protein ACWEFL_13225 [Streptomyces sp. NPDC004838]
MSKSVWRRAGVSLTALAVMAGAAACQSGDGDGGGEKKAAGSVLQSGEKATQALTAAFKKTSEAKSAKVRMKMTMPASAEGGGTMEMSGVIGWDPTVMDMTMNTSGLQVGAGTGTDMPEQIRMLWADNVLYMDMGAEAAKEMDGKRWMTFDVGALAEASGDKALQKRLTGGLENMNQDPAQQLAIMLESKNLKHIGPEKIDGVETQHYKGTLTLDEVIAAEGSQGVISDKERKELLDEMKKSGLKGYDTEVWVNDDGYPVRMNLGLASPEGKVSVVSDYSDYGAKATVQAPPAKDTFDLAEILKGLQKETGQPAA